MRTLARLALHAHAHTRKAPHKFNLEQRLNDSVTPKLASSESDKLSGDPIYTTGTITSTWPTNFGILTKTKHGSFLANNANFEPNYKQRVSSDNTGGSGSSVSQGMSSNLSKVLIFETVPPQRSPGFEQEGMTPYHLVPLFVHQIVPI